MTTLKFPDKEFETIQALMIQALETDCRCISCKGLMVLAKRIKEYNSPKTSRGKCSA